MYTLGIDIGSSYLKAAVFCLENRKMAFSRTMPAFRRCRSDCPELFEVSAEEIYRTVKGLVDELASQYPLQRILLSTQMHGFVYCTPEREDVYVSWQDARSTLPLFPGNSNAIDVLRNLLSDDDLRELGVPLKPSLGICNLYALLYGMQKASEGGELFTLGSYIIWRLTGNNLCHITNAAPLGMVDIRHHCFHQKVLRKTGLDHIKLPQLAQSDYEICGEYHHVNGPIPVLPDYGDQQVSILGAMAHKGDVILNMATAGQLCYLTDQVTPGSYEIRPYFSHEYLYTISDMPSGRNLDVLIRFIQSCVQVATGDTIPEAQIWKQIDESFQYVNTDLRVDSLFFPTKTQFGGGSISGIKPQNLSLMSMLSATYDNMASIYAHYIPALIGDQPPKELVFSGGVSWKNDALVRIIAAKIGLPYRKSAVAQEVFGGMFRLSMVSCGLINNLLEHPQWIIGSL